MEEDERQKIGETQVKGLLEEGERKGRGEGEGEGWGGGGEGVTVSCLSCPSRTTSFCGGSSCSL